MPKIYTPAQVTAAVAKIEAARRKSKPAAPYTTFELSICGQGDANDKVLSAAARGARRAFNSAFLGARRNLTRLYGTAYPATLASPTQPAQTSPPSIEEKARAAYEEDCRRRPTYHDGAPRVGWGALPEFVKDSWRRTPIPKNRRSRPTQC